MLFEPQVRGDGSCYVDEKCIVVAAMQMEAVEFRGLGQQFPEAGLRIAVSVLALCLYGGEVLPALSQQVGIGAGVLFQRRVHDFLLTAGGVVNLELGCE